MQFSSQELASINFFTGIVCSIGGLLFIYLTHRIASIRYLYRSSICVTSMGVMVTSTAFLHSPLFALSRSLEHTWYNIACVLVGLLVTWLFLRSARDRRESVCLRYLLVAEGLTLAVYALEVSPWPSQLLNIVIAGNCAYLIANLGYSAWLTAWLDHCRIERRYTGRPAFCRVLDRALLVTSTDALQEKGLLQEIDLWELSEDVPE
jgi:hypothetical protein